MRDIFVEKLVGVLVLLTCMLWAAAEKPYHDRVGGDLPECTGTYKEVACKKMENRLCEQTDQEYVEDRENRLRIAATDNACTGRYYEGCRPKGPRASDVCKKIFE